MTRRQRRVHLVLWVVLGPALVVLLLFAWHSRVTDGSFAIIEDTAEVSP